VSMPKALLLEVVFSLDPQPPTPAMQSCGAPAAARPAWAVGTEVALLSAGMVEPVALGPSRGQTP